MTEDVRLVLALGAAFFMMCLGIGTCNYLLDSGDPCGRCANLKSTK